MKALSIEKLLFSDAKKLIFWFQKSTSTNDKKQYTISVNKCVIKRALLEPNLSPNLCNLCKLPMILFMENLL